MALFKLRKKVDEPVAAGTPPAESIEVMRRRARHRLIGAVVLVLAGVIGFPLLFDTQPRPVAVDIPIEIPDRNKVKPLPVPQATAGKVVEPAPVVAEAKPAETKPVEAKPVETKPEQPPAETKVATRRPAPQAGEADKPARAETDKPAKPEAKADEGAKARALLEGKSVEAGGRYVVQVGAFAEADKARQAQQKLDRAGLKNYRQVAETDEGKRIRVRAGPFASRAEADQAAEKIKGLDLPARVLTL